MSQTAYKFVATVDPQGKIELALPLPPGTPVEVLVLAAEDDFQDLTAASTTSTDFWDNPQDDEDWNDA